MKKSIAALFLFCLCSAYLHCMDLEGPLDKCRDRYPIHYAAFTNDEAGILEDILASGKYDINQRILCSLVPLFQPKIVFVGEGDYSRSPLEIAMLFNSSRAVDILLSKGADTRFVPDYDASAWSEKELDVVELAIRHDHLESMQVYLRHYPDRRRVAEGIAEHYQGQCRKKCLDWLYSEDDRLQREKEARRLQRMKVFLCKT